MSEYGELIAEGVIRFRRELPGPIERVWDHLVDPELRATWFAGGPLEPVVGGKVAFLFRHADLTPHDERPPAGRELSHEGFTAEAEVTRFEPPHVLAIAFDQRETTFELVEQGDAVVLVLTERGLETREERVGNGAGWHAHLGVLDQRLRHEVPEPFWPRIQRFEREYAERMA